MSADIVVQIIGMIVGAAGTAAGVYGAIRSDLVHSKLVAEMAHKSATRAHERIDEVTIRGCGKCQ